MSLAFQNMSIIKFNILSIPSGEEFSYSIDSNKTFGDLKNDLDEKNIMKKETYYFSLNYTVLNDDLIIKESRIQDYLHICAVDNDGVIINLKVEKCERNFETIRFYVNKAYFRIIKEDENKDITVCGNIFLICFILLLLLLLLYL